MPLRSTPRSEQPTVSYYGSSVWNWLLCNELMHLEHHDFARVPWTRLPKLRRIAPEFYEAPHVVAVPSITGLVWHWLTLPPGKRMDLERLQI